jgi:transaldolase
VGQPQRSAKHFPCREQAGCGIITVTPDILAKLIYVGKDLNLFSLETVKMFYRDALAVGYTIRV